MNRDIDIYKKARGRVRAHFLFYTLALGAFFIFTYVLLEINPNMDPTFVQTFLIVSIGQMILFVVLFLLLSIGWRWLRWLYWLCIPGLFVLFVIPVHFALEDITNYMLYGKYLFCMLLKTMFMIQIGLYLFRNKYCRTFYNKTLEINGEEYELELKSVPEPEPEIEEVEEVKVKETILYTRPQVAIRLGACVYASLILFPAFCQIFSGLFMSMDMQSSFAAKEIFIHCIFSAFIWTIPVFYLYYDQPSSKKCILWCAISECLVMLWYLFHLKAYLDAGSYSMRVFILFIALDLIRYVVIYHFIKPVFYDASK